MSIQPWLVFAALLNATAALAHGVCIGMGVRGYRLFGASDVMVRAAAAGRAWPALVTAGVAAVLALWAVLAASLAGLPGPLPPTLPLARTGLWAVAVIYLLRGLLGPLAIVVDSQRSARFWLWTSALCLAIGAVHVIGLLRLPAP